MREEKRKKIQSIMEKFTRKWWFFLLFVVLQIVPLYVSRDFSMEVFGLAIGEILSGSLLFDVSFLYPLFKILPIIMVALIILKGNQFSRLFSLFAGINYIFIAVLQSMGNSDIYGFGIVLNNLMMFLLVAAGWLWEAQVGRNDFSKRAMKRRRAWVIPLAVLAFWYPIDAASFQPNFSPANIIINEAGLTFCMMTPVYLATLILAFPVVNTVTMRILSIVGTIIGLYNVSLNFIINPSELWWNGLLHLPLLILSIYSLILSYLKRNEI